MKQTLFPVKIIVENGAENAAALLRKKPDQIGLAEFDLAGFSCGSSVTLDFGKEMNGGIRILTFSAENTPVRIRFGESLSECGANIGEKNATNDHANRDFSVTLQNYSDMRFGNTGFRFVRLDFSKNAQIKSVLAENEILSRPAKYVYAGGDAEISRIFQTAKRTVDLCAAGKYVWDGVKRDRLVWIGDMHPEMLALVTLYGRMKKIEDSLDFVKKQSPVPSFMNGFPTYSLWWIIIVADYARLTGAYDFAARQIPYLTALVSLFGELVNDDGTLRFPHYFVDWPTSGTEDEKTGSRFIAIAAAKRAAELLSHFKKSTDGAEILLKKLQKGDLSVKAKKQVVALKYFALGEISDREYALLTAGGAAGMSTFMSYYVLRAVAAKDAALALRLMKEYYGGMLSLGATTFWEDFDISWKNSCPVDRLPRPKERDVHGDHGAYCYKGFRHSLCHGWSAGVIRFIAENCNDLPDRK